MLSAIVVAAGESRRMGFDKLFAAIGGKPVVAHAIRAFEGAGSVDEIIVVSRADRRAEIAAIIRDEHFKKVRTIVPGGARRQDSVRAGLAQIGQNQRYVAVHDAARPLVTPGQIERVFEQCQIHGAAALAEPIKDTLKRADAAHIVTGSVDRDQLYAMQTPQVFERELLDRAYDALFAENLSVTDEVSAVQRLGRKVALVIADDLNFKITYPRDLAIADFVLRQRAGAAGTKSG